jgi:DNA-binding IclR family transcriptional regulator
MKPATSIEKVCKVFHAFRSKPSMGITEVAERTGLLCSDVHRILRSLQHFGFVSQNPRTKKYELGLELLKLGHLVHERTELCGVARPYMRLLSEAAQATANLAVFDPQEREVLFVEQIDSPAEVQIRLRIGRRVSPHATSVGKVLLAHLDSETVAAIVRDLGLPKITRYTITDPAQFEKELETIRLQGYGADREEAVIGACCMGAPVRNHEGKVVAAVSISMMAAHVSRAEEPQLASLVKTAGANISKALGY